MNLYPHTITVYNRHLPDFSGPHTPRAQYGRTVVEGVAWNDKIRHNADASGISVLSKTISIVIPLKADAGVKTYIPPDDYAKLSTDETNKHWTFNVDQTNPDIIVFGECQKEITDEYTIQNLLKDVKAATIQAVADFTNSPVLQHWEVGGV